MGLEFRLRVQDGDWPPTVVSPQTFLDRLSQRVCFASHPVTATPAGPGMIELRGSGNPSTMPDVVVQIEERGFYLLDNTRASLADLVLAELVRYLLGYYARVTIEEP